jgi:TPR repeat protein
MVMSSAGRACGLLAAVAVLTVSEQVKAQATSTAPPPASPATATPPNDLPLAIAKARTGDPSGLVQLADAGQVEAQALLGDYYLNNPKVKRDPKEARRWLEKAAAQKHPVACRMLGELYDSGEGGRRDKKKAMELWKTAEGAGDRLTPILMADAMFSEITGGKKPGPGQYAFKGGIPVRDIEVIEDWYREAQSVDPRPEVHQRAGEALRVLATFKSAANSEEQKP